MSALCLDGIKVKWCHKCKEVIKGKAMSAVVFGKVRYYCGDCVIEIWSEKYEAIY